MIRVLVLSSDTDGVGYFRTLMPNLCINDPDIKIELRLLSDGTLPLFDENFLKQFNLIFYNKVIPFPNPEKEDIFYGLCKKHNIKVLYDIDDYWILDSTHLNYKNWKTNKSQEKIEGIMAKADAVTTTTSIFADKIREINPEVYVLPNAINHKEQQWDQNKYESNKTRFLWGGGISHIVDLRLIKDEFKKFDKNFLEKSQFVMCGFDMRIKMQQGGLKKDDPRRSQWGFFEGIFSNNGKYIKGMEYRNFLNNSSNFDNDIDYGRKEEFLDEFYQRRHTKPILLYGTQYRECDVSVAPLKNNHSFNRMKSQLKLIEAGIYKCPVIQSNYGPYTIDDIEGKKDGIQKGWLIDEGKNNWYEKMKWYVDNPSAVKEHGEAAHEYVMENYSMEVVGKQRVALYKEIASRDRK